MEENMKKSIKELGSSVSLKSKLMLSAAMFVTSLHPNSVLAQDTPAPVDTIVAIGSQIKGASVTAALPVSVLGQDEIAAVGAGDMDELLRTLPGAGDMSFGGSGTNSVSFGINGARGDVASINLRSLGAGNTLVLLNGRRLVDHSGTQTNEQTVPEQTSNVNSIPVMGVSRIEVLRDGASAIYGTDAVAGVVNTVLRDDYEGLEVSSRYGSSFGTSLDEHTINAIGGFRVNNDKTRVTFSVNRYERDGMLANERLYSANSDMRPLFVGTDWEGDTDFRNNSTSTPWLQITIPGGSAITSNGQQVTSKSGRFFIIPDSYDANCIALPGEPAGTCISDVSALPEALRFNPNARRTMIQDSKRINLFSTIVTEFENGWEMYTELGYYTAKSFFNNAAGNAGSLSHSPLWIPKSNYYNPFGSLYQADGVTPNPYRLPNLVGVPVEGIDLAFDGALGASYRALETDRETTVEDESFRIVQGFRGEYAGWDIDTGFVYSESETLDRTTGRQSATQYIYQLGLNTPNAYNPFNGGGDYPTNSLDGTPNSPDQYNPFTITVDRFSKSTLMLADLKVSNPSIFELPGGDVGFASGIEFRRTTYLDDRDDRLDGTIKYTLDNPFFGPDVLFGDVTGSSPTPDTIGSRKVLSLFGELAVPLVNADMDIPMINSLDLQLAGRFEDFSDVGSVFKPRIALSWYLTDDLQMRASYSYGFRAPNLPQVTEGRSSRTVARADTYFCQAAVKKGLATDLGSCTNATLDADPGYLYSEGGVERITFGGADLKPETSKSFSVGAVWTPEFIDGLILTVDFWRISQEGIIGIFGTPNHLNLDYALRTTGVGTNPNVIRLAPTQDIIDFFAGSGLAPVGEAVQTLNPYSNLESRITRGIDFAAIYRLRDTSVGDFTFNIGATKLLSADQSPDGDALIINALNNPFVNVVAGGDLIEQNGRRPSWKGSGSVSWFKDNFTTTLFVNYVGPVQDSSAINSKGDFYRTTSWTTVNTSVAYRFDDGALDGLQLKVGMNNIFDVDPPLADENLGYFAGLHNPLGRYGYVDVRYSF
jgi:iron complex outermembrane recepter protein